MTMTIGTVDLLGLATATLIAKRRPLKTTRDRARESDEDGDYIQASDVAYNVRDEGSQEYHAIDSTTFADIDITLGGTGAGTGDYVITQAAAEYVAGEYTKITLTFHKHASQAAHTAKAYTITLPYGMGLPTTIDGITVNEGCQRCSITATVKHIDHIKGSGTNTGKHLGGGSIQGEITATFESVDGSVPTVPAAYVVVDQDNNTESEVFNTAAVSMRRALVAD